MSKQTSSEKASDATFDNPEFDYDLPPSYEQSTAGSAYIDSPPTHASSSSSTTGPLTLTITTTNIHPISHPSNTLYTLSSDPFQARTTTIMLSKVIYKPPPLPPSSSSSTGTGSDDPLPAPPTSTKPAHDRTLYRFRDLVTMAESSIEFLPQCGSKLCYKSMYMVPPRSSRSSMSKSWRVCAREADAVPAGTVVGAGGVVLVAAPKKVGLFHRHSRSSSSSSSSSSTSAGGGGETEWKDGRGVVVAVEEKRAAVISHATRTEWRPVEVREGPVLRIEEQAVRLGERFVDLLVTAWCAKVTAEVYDVIPREKAVKTDFVQTWKQGAGVSKRI